MLVATLQRVLAIQDLESLERLATMPAALATQAHLEVEQALQAMELQLEVHPTHRTAKYTATCRLQAERLLHTSQASQAE